MSGPRLDRRTLSNAPRGALRRLATFIGLPLPTKCSETTILEALVRELDRTEAHWPPRLSERKW